MEGKLMTSSFPPFLGEVECVLLYGGTVLLLHSHAPNRLFFFRIKYFFLFFFLSKTLRVSLEPYIRVFIILRPDFRSKTSEFVGHRVLLVATGQRPCYGHVPRPAELGKAAEVWTKTGKKVGHLSALLPVAAYHLGARITSPTERQ